MFATQKPGNESNIPTFTSPPYLGFGNVEDVGDGELVEGATVMDGAVVVLSGSEVELAGMDVVGSVAGAAVVSLVVESEHAETSKNEATKNATNENLFGRRVREVIIMFSFS